jgi:hypothetical protein
MAPKLDQSNCKKFPPYGTQVPEILHSPLQKGGEGKFHTSSIYFTYDTCEAGGGDGKAVQNSRSRTKKNLLTIESVTSPAPHPLLMLQAAFLLPAHRGQKNEDEH